MRGLDNRFLGAMREKMQSGRNKGRVGWDRYWLDTYFRTNDPANELFSGLQAEIIELSHALRLGNKKDIKYEAADVANYAMMIADITDSLDTH